MDAPQSLAPLIGSLNLLVLTRHGQWSEQQSLHLGDGTLLSAFWQILQRNPSSGVDHTRWLPLKLMSCRLLAMLISKQIAPVEKVSLSGFLDILTVNASLPLIPELLSLFETVLSFAPRPAQEGGPAVVEAFQFWTLCLGWVTRAHFGHEEVTLLARLARALFSFLDSGSPEIGMRSPPRALLRC